jgi:hypothetical protein
MQNLQFAPWEVIAAFVVPIAGFFAGKIFEADKVESHARRSQGQPPVMKRKWVVALLSLVAVAIQVMYVSASWQHNIYRPELALAYQDKYDNMAKKRAEAATVIFNYLQTTNWDMVTNASKLDPVLDLFEDLGFYSQHGELSDEVIYHHFYTAIRTYCQPTENYILDVQKSEPASWNHLLPLFHRLTQMEAQDTKTTVEQCQWDRTNLLDYIKDEMDLKREDK